MPSITTCPNCKGIFTSTARACPHCGQPNYVPEPVQPESCRCGRCAQTFPIIPVDRRTLQYLRIMFDNGRAAADIDFI